MKNTKFTHKTPHLKGKQHQLDPNLDLKQLVHHATIQYVDWDNDGDVDEYDKKPKLVPDENPTANFARDSKKLIVKQRGEIKHTRRGIAYEETKSGDESLYDWFNKSRSSDGTPGWVQLGGKYAGKPCAKQPGQTTKPKCGSSKMKRNLDSEEEQRAFERKNRQDPNPDRKGKAKNVATEAKEELRYCPKCKKAEKRSDCAYGTKYWDNNAEPITVEEVSGGKDACYHKVKSRYKVWPSAYASGALVKCRKKGADNWGTKSEEYGFSNWREDFKEFTDLIKPETFVSESCCSECGKEPCGCGIKRPRGGSTAKLGPDKNYVKPMGEEIEEAVRIPAKTGNIVFVNLTWRGKYYGIKVFFPNTKVPSRKEVQNEIEKVYPGSRVYSFKVSEYEPGQPLLQVSESIDKDTMKCNKPKAQAVGDSQTGKSHVVKACEDGEEKIIRFGQRGVKGSPKKEGESKEYASRRHRFQSRHAKNIAKGKMSAAYWANKVKW